jgi:hypothetical protein
MADGPLDGLPPGLAVKNPPKKNPPKKNNQKNPPKKPQKMFCVFLNFKFFMKIIQTFFFETDFYGQIRPTIIYLQKIVRYALN